MPFAITGLAGPFRFSSELPALEFTAVDNVGPVEWSVNYGVMAPAIGDSSILNPLNLTRTIKHGGPVIVTGKDTGTDPWTEATATLEIVSTLPVVPDWGIEDDIDPGFELSEAEAGDPKFRDLPITATTPLTFRVRQFMDYAAARAFLYAHKTLPFWVEDWSIGELRMGFRVSAIRRLRNRTNLLEYSFQFKDFNYMPPASAADIGPWAAIGAGDAPPEYGDGEYGG